MKTPNEDDLGFDRLDKMIEAFKSKPIFEDPKWNQVLTELGRITVYFEGLSFNLKWLLVTLENPRDLTMTPNRYARTMVSEVIKKCQKALRKLETDIASKSSTLTSLFKDCHEQLGRCDQLNRRRNNLIHALWFSQAFRTGSVTRIRMTKPETGGTPGIESDEHNWAELRAVALEIRNAGPPVYSLMTKLRIAMQQIPKS
jgi:hypothetical protein